jgi:hypothetical protein
MRIKYLAIFMLMLISGLSFLSGCSSLEVKPESKIDWEEQAWQEKQPNELMDLSNKVEKGLVEQIKRMGY